MEPVFCSVHWMLRDSEDFLTVADSALRTWPSSREMTCSLADVLSRHASWPLILSLHMVRCIESPTRLEMHFSVWVNSPWSFPLWHPLQYRHRLEDGRFLVDPRSGTVILEWFSIHLLPLLCTSSVTLHGGWEVCWHLLARMREDSSLLWKK